MEQPAPPENEADREARVLAEARMMRHVFGEGCEDAIERLIASALDHGALDRVMFLLDVQSTLYGLPIGHFAAEGPAWVTASAERAEVEAQMRTFVLPVQDFNIELSRRRALRAGR